MPYVNASDKQASEPANRAFVQTPKAEESAPGLSIPATRPQVAPWEIEFLFRTEGVRGIDFGGTHRWDVAGHRRGGG